MANLSENQELFVRTIAETLSETRKGRFVVLRKMIEAGWNNRTNSIRPAAVIGAITCVLWDFHTYSDYPENAKWHREYGADIEFIWREINGDSQLAVLTELCAKADAILAEKNVLSDEEFSDARITWVNPDSD